MKKMKIPARISNKDVNIETDVVHTNILLLLSQKSMKKANTEINFETDTVVMLGEQQELPGKIHLKCNHMVNINLLDFFEIL